MPSVAQREYTVLAGLIIIFAIALIPSLLAARAEVRDGLRRQDVTYLKRSLEQFYNEHEQYPLVSPSPEGNRCVTSLQTKAWPFITALPHDVRESDGFIYRYCVTSSNIDGALGYFIEAQLERDQRDQQTFDEDELRKFYYRILHDNEKTLYRVCGGEEKQCEPV